MIATPTRYSEAIHRDRAGNVLAASMDEKAHVVGATADKASSGNAAPMSEIVLRRTLGSPVPTTPEATGRLWSARWVRLSAPGDCGAGVLSTTSEAVG